MEPKSEPTVVADAQPWFAHACFVCQKPILDSEWFCRLPQRKAGVVDFQAPRILLCSPVCALKLFGETLPGGGSPEPGYDGNESALPSTTRSVPGAGDSGPRLDNHTSKQP